MEIKDLQKLKEETDKIFNRQERLINLLIFEYEKMMKVWGIISFTFFILGIVLGMKIAS